MITLEKIGRLFRVKVVMNNKATYKDFRLFRDALEYRDNLLRWFMKIKERFSGAVIMDDVTKGEAIYEKTTRADRDMKFIKGLAKKETDGKFMFNLTWCDILKVEWNADEIRGGSCSII